MENKNVFDLFDTELVENSPLDKCMKARFSDALHLALAGEDSRYSNFEVAVMLQNWAKDLIRLTKPEMKNEDQQQ